MGKKKWLRGVMAMAVAGSLLISAAPGSLQAPKASAAVKLTGKTKKVAYRNTFVGKHGRLRVKGTKLVDKKGKAVQLRGISSHGINWDVGEPFVNEKALRNLRDEWGVNCFRVAMYTEDYNGYCVTDTASRKKLLAKIDTAVKAGRKLGMVIRRKISLRLRHFLRKCRINIEKKNMYFMKSAMNRMAVYSGRLSNRMQNP